MNTAKTSYWKGESLSYVNRSRLQLLHFRPQSPDFTPFPNIVLKGKHHVRHNFKPNFANAMKLLLSFFTFPNDTLVVGRKVSSFYFRMSVYHKNLAGKPQLTSGHQAKIGGDLGISNGGGRGESFPPSSP